MRMKAPTMNTSAVVLESLFTYCAEQFENDGEALFPTIVKVSNELLAG